jgi:deoxycytidylate deaminase
VEAIKRSGESTHSVVERLCSPYHIGAGRHEPRAFCFCFKDEMAKKDATPRLLKPLRQKIDELFKKPSEATQDASPEMAERVTNNMGRLITNCRGRPFASTEYCLALHAEENAILQNARIGGVGLEGATIYTTALPCTLCAKMIEQVGLKRVVYTEPYPKSLTDIYMRSTPVQFEGVKPRAYVRLFMPDHDQKEWQNLARGLIPTRETSGPDKLRENGVRPMKPGSTHDLILAGVTRRWRSSHYRLTLKPRLHPPAPVPPRGQVCGDKSISARPATVP